MPVEKTIRMPKDDLVMVLAMLRNPKNKDAQGQGHLFRKDADIGQPAGYCCLGAMQCAKTGGFVEVSSTRPATFSSYPSKKWLKSVGWSFKDDNGWDTCNPYLPTLDCSASIANDSLELSFAKIADAIEACAETY